MRGMIESHWCSSLLSHMVTQKPSQGCRGPVMYFPSLGQNGYCNFTLAPPATYNSWLTLNHRDNLPDSHHHGNCSPNRRSTPPRHPQSYPAHPSSPLLSKIDQSCHFHSFARPFRKAVSTFLFVVPGGKKNEEKEKQHHTLTPTTIIYTTPPLEKKKTNPF